MTQFITKDSGQREVSSSGMKRDVQTGKPRFDLTIPIGQKYTRSMMYRLAMLMARGAEKYGERDWERAEGEDELLRFKSSAYRHFMQWYFDEEDEDHAAGTWFNMNAHEFVKEKIEKQASIKPIEDSPF